MFRSACRGLGFRFGLWAGCGVVVCLRYCLLLVFGVAVLVCGVLFPASLGWFELCCGLWCLGVGWLFVWAGCCMLVC